MRNFLFLTFIFVAACGGNAVVDQGQVGSGGARSTGTTTSTETGTSSSGACPDGGMPIPVQFKTCTTKSDCTEQLIYVDCCGRQEAIGVSASQVQAFNAFEKACSPVVPACACDPGPTLAEDGQSVLPDAPIQLACKAGLCSTFVP